MNRERARRVIDPGAPVALEQDLSELAQRRRKERTRLNQLSLKLSAQRSSICANDAHF
jgi:hypothetical protein